MGKDKDKDNVSYLLKTPKGTKDCEIAFGPLQQFLWLIDDTGEGKDMVIRDQIFKTIIDVFKRHGAVTIDTPVFELRQILSGKYGEDSKLIYDLSDQGGEICSLRYDLTVPFARWLAMNPQVQTIKRYHIAKVYRRDQPAMTKGRMREFYQCDFDIAGAYDRMVPDAEIIRIVCEVFGEKGLGWSGKDGKGFTVKLNHRGVLDGVFQVCGVPQEKIRTISSAVDKLDKSPWEEVRKEMIEEKGLSEEVADKIWGFVQRKGGKDVLAELEKDEKAMANESLARGLEDMELLLSYLEAFDVLDLVEFNLSLARGLDYYTGIIYEVVTEGSAPQSATDRSKLKPAKKTKEFDEDRSHDPSVGVGSVAAGGRYDELVGMFSGKTQIPCVGISFGVDRIFSITKARMESDKNASSVRPTDVDVFVMAFGGKGFTGLLTERMRVAKMLWDADIKAEFAYKQKPKLPAQFGAAEKNGIPFAVILGEDEQAQGKVKIKEMGLPEGHPEKDGILVDLACLVEELQKRLQKNLQKAANREDLVKSTNGLKVTDEAITQSN